ncbi:helix-turn-helix domain-containing protein [Pseudomonas aeruginosa]|uniref:helix-turn-helix domain-containing protein n=1 Tax=Pseudomonas aeruginosa TaxID=287 RepID=UPI0009A42594|nr:helix-turn-helix transcriptional regulator [Pseudomonas aeruginosa]EKL0658100.1 helix-turn-helix transcriptional regulator [Pseudomonas aeruginosa]EKL8243672.1 helix-turn-helix transcriptional regulator [Pseudomonas aeruginosa]EKL8601728.1 helix-turn-helix transcriptional regulator [Pseudomonas aeruginosa]EKT0601706.1 helix-turn-helix transcriptional regulator [Pseudomonas aeruginosa]EKU4546824.1 helix-turn-helix transcriptional regulator [Pseudomonas aeruginosa]
MGCHLGFCGETKLAETKHSLAAAIRTVRKARGLSQEAFSDVSSRTYMSSLERDLKSPTINKLAELCEVMEIHPMTLLALAYGGDAKGVDLLIERVRREVAEVQDASDTI